MSRTKKITSFVLALAMTALLLPVSDPKDADLNGSIDVADAVQLAVKDAAAAAEALEVAAGLETAIQADLDSCTAGGQASGQLAFVPPAVFELPPVDSRAISFAPACRIPSCALSIEPPPPRFV